MTWIQAESIKQDFVVAMQFADICGKTRKEAYTETAKKYTSEELAEAMIVLRKHKEEEIETTNALFILAIRGKEKNMPEKNKPRLIASTPNAKELLKAAAQYFCDKQERYDLAEDEKGTLFLLRDGNILKGYRITKKQGRFRFEAV